MSGGQLEACLISRQVGPQLSQGSGVSHQSPWPVHPPSRTPQSETGTQFHPGARSNTQLQTDFPGAEAAVQWMVSWEEPPALGPRATGGCHLTSEMG